MGRLGDCSSHHCPFFLKFYPAVLFGVIALVARNRKQLPIAVIGGLCLLAVWLYLSAGELCCGGGGRRRERASSPGGAGLVPPPGFAPGGRGAPPGGDLWNACSRALERRG